MKLRTLAQIALLALILGIGISRYGVLKKQNQQAHDGLISPTAQDEDQLPPLPTFPVTLVDGEGKSIRIDSLPRRIVSLSPGATEILFDLNCKDRIAADTTACDWPADAKLKPHIGGFSDMSLEKIVAQNPDLIVADASLNQKIITALETAHLPVLVISPKTLLDIYGSIRLLGRATGETVRAEDIVHLMRKRLNAVRDSVHLITERRKVLIMYAVDPIYTTGKGSFIDDIITLAGGENIAKTNDPLSAEEVVLDAPEVIICDLALRPKIAALPGWKDSVPAVINTAYFQPSPAATLLRPTPRIVLAAEELARCLHPEVFSSNGKPMKPLTDAASPPAKPGAKP